MYISSLFPISRYQQYLKTTPINPSHRLSCGGKKYGDDGFFLHKSVTQLHNTTVDTTLRNAMSDPQKYTHWTKL